MNFKQWLLLTEAKKSSDIARELLGNNENLLNQIKAKIPKDIKPDLQAKLLPIAAYYHKQQPDLKTLEQDIKDYAELVKNQKMPIITVNDDLTIDNKHFQNYIGWTEVIHGKQAEDKILNAPIPQGNLEDQELIEESPDGKIKVYKANSVNQCIILGKGERFCISQPANTMFQSYRDTKVSTFYFVYDNTRTDDLAIVVVDATKQRIELTDRKNQTASTMQDPYSNTPNRIQSNPQLYFKYLKEHGIDTSIFVNIPKNQEEEAEQLKLGEKNYNLEWLKSLTQEEKSKYIGRGHELSNEQFDYLYDNKFMFLLTQYVRTGRKINDYQLEKVAKFRELKDKYLHNRIIADRHSKDFSKKEYELLNPKQKEEYIGRIIDEGIELSNEQFDYLYDNKFMSLLTQYVKLGRKLNDYQLEKVVKVRDLKDKYLHNRLIADRHLNNFSKKEYELLNLKQKEEFFDVDADKKFRRAINIGNLEKLKEAVIRDGAKIAYHAVKEAAANGYYDIVKYLVEEKKSYISSYTVDYAAKSGNLELVKYLVEKVAEIGDDALRHAAANGNLDLAKYLLGDEVKDNKGNIIKLPNGIQSAKISDIEIIHAKNQEIKDYLIQKQKEKQTK